MRKRTRRGRSGGLTLVELFASLAAISVMLLLGGRLALLAFRFRETADASVRPAIVSERLRRALLEVAGEARPVASVAGVGGKWSTDEGDLCLSSGSRALVVVQAGPRLLLFRLPGARGGPSRAEELGRGVERATFAIARGPDGSARGVAFELSFRDRREVERGFVALRAPGVGP